MKRLGAQSYLLVKDENGGVIILVALLIVALLGMTALVIDVGALYQARRQMVNAADAAALAGAQELIYNPGGVEPISKDYAIRLNGADNDKVKVTSTSNTVTVETGREVPYSFARVLNIGNSSDVGATATALIYHPIAIGDLVPFAIPYIEGAYVVDEDYTLKVGNWKEGPIGPGNFGAVRFPGDSGANDYRERIKNGYPGLVYIDQTLNTEPGNMDGPTKQGVDYRIDNYDPPIVLIPVFEEPIIDGNGRGTLKVVAFAAFELHAYIKGTGQVKDQVKGRFVSIITEGPRGVVEPPNVGIYAITLIE